MTRKLDIFKVLSQLDSKNIEFYDSLTVDEQKAFLPIVVTMWLGGTNDPRQLMLLNECVNPYVFELYDHKALLYKLMTVCTSGSKKRYKWNRKKKSGKSTNLATEVIKRYYGYNTSQAIDAIKLLSKEDILNCAEELGYQQDEIKKLKGQL